MIRSNPAATRFTSRLTVEECVERLHAVTKPTSPPSPANDVTLPLAGSVDPRAFRVARCTEYRNSFQTEVRGEWRALPGGETEIVLTTVPAQVGLFIAFWCTFLGGVGLLALFAGISSGNLDLKFPFGALVLMVFGVALAKHGSARAAVDAAFVVSTIAETLEAAPLDDRESRANARRERALKRRAPVEPTGVDSDDSDEDEPESSGRPTQR